MHLIPYNYIAAIPPAHKTRWQPFLVKLATCNMLLPGFCYFQVPVPYINQPPHLTLCLLGFPILPPELMHFGMLPCLQLLPHPVQVLSLATHLEAPHPDKAGTCKRPAQSLSNKNIITEHAGSYDAGQHCPEEVAALAPDRPGKHSADNVSLAMQSAIPCRRSSAKRALPVNLSKRSIHAHATL